MADDWKQRLIQLLVGHDPNVEMPETTYNGITFPAVTGFQGGAPVGGIGGAAGMLGRGVTSLRGPIRGVGGVGPSASHLPGSGARALGTNASPAARGTAEVIGVTRNARPALPAGRIPGPAAIGTRPVGRTGPVNINAGPSLRTRPLGRETTQLARNQARTSAVRGATGVAAAGAAGLTAAQLRNLLRGDETAQPTDTPEGFPTDPTSPSTQEGLSSPADYQGLEDALANYQTSTPSNAVDPYSEFLNDYISQITGAYDSQIDAIAGLGPLFQEEAAEAQGNIGNFFGYAGDVAREGMPVTADIYDTAQGNVNDIYDGLAAGLANMPGEMVDRASAAAGGDIGSSVAGRVAAATAPFAAAGETSRANATSNLVQGSAAGQNYLNNLAASTTGEGALHQSAVEQAMNQQLQLVAYRQAELEGAKQRALMEITTDIAGDSSERMANQALSQALGLNLPGEVDPMDYLRGQGLMAGDAGDPIGAARDLVGLQQAELNYAQDADPNFQMNQVLGGLSPNSQETFAAVQRLAEGEATGGPDGVPDQRAVAMKMLELIDEQYGEGNLAFFGIPESARRSAVGADALDQSRNELQQAIRTLMM